MWRHVCKQVTKCWGSFLSYAPEESHHKESPEANEILTTTSKPQHGLRPSALWTISTRLPVLGFFLLMFVALTSTLPTIEKKLGGWLDRPAPVSYQPPVVRTPIQLPSSPGERIIHIPTPAAPPPLTIGSTRDQVLAALGKPDKEDGKTWFYGATILYFDGDRVAGWADRETTASAKAHQQGGGLTVSGGQVAEELIEPDQDESPAARIMHTSREAAKGITTTR